MKKPETKLSTSSWEMPANAELPAAIGKNKR